MKIPPEFHGVNMLFSIIIPTYNRAEFIGKTIQSFLDQTFEDFELIVVDDGSTDATEEVVLSIKDQRIRYYKKENAERGAARNFGAAKAQGQYLNFFDSDDIAYRDYLETAANFINNSNNPEAFHINYEFKDANGKILIRKRKIKDINKQIIYGNILGCIGVFIRKDIFSKFKFSENRELSGSEDYLLWLQISFSYKIHSIDKVAAAIIQHTSRSVEQTDREKLIKRENLLNSILEETCGELDHFKMNKKVIQSNFLLYVSLHLVLLGDKKSSINYLWQAIKTYPASLFSIKSMVICKKILIN